MIRDNVNIYGQMNSPNTVTVDAHANAGTSILGTVAATRRLARITVGGTTSNAVLCATAAGAPTGVGLGLGQMLGVNAAGAPVAMDLPSADWTIAGSTPGLAGFTATPAVLSPGAWPVAGANRTVNLAQTVSLTRTVTVGGLYVVHFGVWITTGGLFPMDGSGMFQVPHSFQGIDQVTLTGGSIIQGPTVPQPGLSQTGMICFRATSTSVSLGYRVRQIRQLTAAAAMAAPISSTIMPIVQTVEVV